MNVNRILRVVLAVAVTAASVAIVSCTAKKTETAVAIYEKVDQATLHKYHHTDQGTRIVPAAFLAALKTADGNNNVMSRENLTKWGFLYDSGPADTLNPYGWPVGFTVSDPSVTKGIPVAGVTCAACHTGQLEYRGAIVRIEGGQANVNLPEFQGALFAAIEATAKDSVRAGLFFKDAVAAGYPAERVKADFGIVAAGAKDLFLGQKLVTGTLPGPGRVDAVQGIANAVFGTALKVPSNNKNFDAPVSYPYLWDIWRLTWVQYNGFLPPQSLSRNIGETLGTSGKMNFINPVTGTLNPEPERWQTSVQFKNLISMESTLKRFRAPGWPGDVLGAVDPAKAAGGSQLFAQHCASCHGIKELPNGNWDVSVVPLNVIGTDPNQAVNWGGRTYDASKLGLGSAVKATALSTAINAIRRQFYAESKVPVAEQEPDVTPEAPCGYKARPLIGVWATPPFLHNGSVRTIFELLSDTRPASFKFGSREFDPVNLGYVEDLSADAVTLDTSISGNRNAGHWLTDDPTRPGRIGPKLSDDQKYAIIEFLKSATYENYPAVKADYQAALPCASDKDWAKNFQPR
jgi:hypothetical protein